MRKPTWYLQLLGPLLFVLVYVGKLLRFLGQVLVDLVFQPAERWAEWQLRGDVAAVEREMKEKLGPSRWRVRLLLRWALRVVLMVSVLVLWWWLFRLTAVAGKLWLSAALAVVAEQLTWLLGGLLVFGLLALLLWLVWKVGDLL